MTKVSLLIFESYLALIKNSVDSNLFRNLYAQVDQENKDNTNDGNLSCAFFVSSVLVLFKLIGEGHATVKSTVADMEESGWKEIKEPKIGSILVWEKKEINGGLNSHIGFYLGDNQAISNNSKTGKPVTHHWTYNQTRKVEEIYWHQKLD